MSIMLSAWRDRGRSKSAISEYVLINNSSTRQGAVPPSLAWADTSDGYGTGSQTSPNAEGARSRGRNGSTGGRETGMPLRRERR